MGTAGRVAGLGGKAATLRPSDAATFGSTYATCAASQIPRRGHNQLNVSKTEDITGTNAMQLLLSKGTDIRRPSVS